MIHHLARAFFIRNDAALAAGHLAAHPGHPDAGPNGSTGNTSNGVPTPRAPAEGSRPAHAPSSRPVKARPITPWGTPSRTGSMGHGLHGGRRVRICTDPADARRTVIAGRFAEVCAALDRLVLEQEAVA